MIDLFYLHDTKGFPLTYSLFVCMERNIKPNWASFFAGAREINKKSSSAWGFDKVRSVIESALADSGYPATFMDVVREVFCEALELPPVQTEAPAPTVDTPLEWASALL